MQRLDQKRIAVTGAAGGLGVPLARLLRERGAYVIGIDRVECPGCDENIVTDLSDDASLALLAGRLAQETPDILVNLAGVMRFGLHEGQPRDALALCYHVNLYVPAVLAQAVSAPMRARGHGQIVNIGSVLGAIPYPWFAAYSSSKAGLAALSQSLRRELAGSGVSVTHINPRAAKTSLNNSEVNRFLDITNMKADEPEKVAQRIVEAIVGCRETVTIGRMERLYGIVNALAPRLIDNGIAPQIRRARAEFCR
ncbi:Short-chain dehydrogenase/reductase SDR [Sphingobium chlorophenolicum]|uniref:Short-chain dehydrogenase/reductase SDR n=1 Tax=Sphingobium chlorophenolicum TaxID=46429 RepID=A0A081RCG3_SPHCR|nr:SDR family NAD(P)-dependent oxidoreductase [Sphingobium chlorophenolicum]KEQ52886.1 Short-chain dehydrogenase/reductase SDR [Sphingobium chlorophenolicum]